ncbi:MAG: flippase-like domain-containing protein [Alphaproteobacteria bacterium]|nr:flippase-like domain-containing protein [Alphaproteobacteria bacterium]
MNRKLATGLAVSAVLLALLLLRVDAAEVTAAFAAARPGWLALTLALHLGVLSLKAVRWGVVLDAVPHGPRPRWLTFDALFLGYFGNYVLPAKLGELGRSALYSDRSGLPLTATLATILFERLVDAAVLVAAFYVVVLSGALPFALPAWMETSARTAGLAALAGLLGLAWVARRGPLQGRLATLQRHVEAALSGLAPLRDARVIGITVAWTALIWSVEAASIGTVLRAFGHPLPAAGAVVQMVISSFAIAAPSAPGGLGIHQWVTVLVLDPWGVPAADATAASLVMTFAVVLWVVPLGLAGLWRQGSSLGALQRAVDAQRNPERG